MPSFPLASPPGDATFPVNNAIFPWTSRARAVADWPGAGLRAPPGAGGGAAPGPEDPDPSIAASRRGGSAATHRDASVESMGRWVEGAQELVPG